MLLLVLGYSARDTRQGSPVLSFVKHRLKGESPKESERVMSTQDVSLDEDFVIYIFKKAQKMATTCEVSPSPSAPVWSVEE